MNNNPRVGEAVKKPPESRSAAEEIVAEMVKVLLAGIEAKSREPDKGKPPGSD